MAKAKGNPSKEPKNYNHTDQHPQRPDIGTEPHFKKKKLPETYRYDSSDLLHKYYMLQSRVD